MNHVSMTPYSIDKLQAMFQIWKTSLARTGDPRFQELPLELDARDSTEFHVSISAKPVIVISTGAMANLYELVSRFCQQSDFFSHQHFSQPASELLMTLSFQWLMCHEAAHWLLGHPEFLNRNHNSLLAGLDLPETLLGVSGESQWHADRIENMCSELQADSFAVEMMDAICHPMADPAPNEWAAWIRDQDDFSKLRIITVAAGLVMLLFETKRRVDYYPTPATRVFNLLNIILGLANFDSLVFRENGPAISGSDEHTLLTLKRSFHEIVLPAGLDLHDVSSILNIETTFLHFEEGRCPTLEDLLLSSGVRKSGDFQTEGAREFAEMDHHLHTKVRTKWLPFSKVSVWMPSP